MKKYNHPVLQIILAAILALAALGTKAQPLNVYRVPAAENKVALLPITYVAEGSDFRAEQMRYRLQNIAYLFLKDGAVELKFQDPEETNALLLKKGITQANYREYTPKELAALLEVEYVLTGMVVQENVGMHVNSNSSREYSTNRKGNRIEKWFNENSRARQEMSTNVDLSVYNDKGEKIFTMSRHSWLSDLDAYKNAMHFVLKRSPLYRR